MAELDTRYENTTDQLHKLARDALQEAENTARRIRSSGIPDLTKPTIDYNGPKRATEPPDFSEVLGGFEGLLGEEWELPDGVDDAYFVDFINTRVNEWFDKFFPVIGQRFTRVPEDILVDIISGIRPFGLSETVFELVWNRARDSEIKRYRSQEATLREEMSMRGFSMPTGAMLKAMQDIRSEASGRINEVAREEAIRHEEIKVRLLEFAIQTANNIKLGIYNALADFLRAWIQIPEAANARAATNLAYQNSVFDRDRLTVDIAKAKSQAYSSLYSALNSYYQAETALQELSLRAQIANADASLAYDRNRISVYNSDGAAGALGQAVQGFASIAGDAANAAGSLIAQIEGL